jgi:organic hydroperoxide reductase OsmC/OhrA
MSTHRVAVSWSLAEDADAFLKRRYSRVHRLAFGGGVEIEGGAAASVVPAQYTKAAAMDPEAAFTASLSACHMLWFLDHAIRAGLVVADYRDAAEGLLARNPAGKLAMTRVTLRPAVTFAGERRPTGEEIDRLHAAAHADCFIANSVTTEVVIDPAP